MKTLQKKSCPILRVLPAIFIATEHIYIDIAANSAPILVKYSFFSCPHGCFLWIWHYLDWNWGSLSLISKHTYIQHSANCSKIRGIAVLCVGHLYTKCSFSKWLGTFSRIFQPILHCFWLNKVYYLSRAIINLLCEFAVTCIKSDRAFLIANRQADTHILYIHTYIR